MARIEWDDSLNTGVDAIDEQHKYLLSIVNRVLDALAQKRRATTVRKVLEELRAYTAKHFHAEEAFMRQIGYPDLAAHQKQHALLRMQVKDFSVSLYHGTDVTLDSVKEFLSVWLLTHILTYDRKVSAFIREPERNRAAGD